MATDISSLYGQPITDYGFLFEANIQEDIDSIARMNAAILAVSEVTSNRSLDAGEVFTGEYDMLSGLPSSSQEEYMRNKASIRFSQDLKRDVSRILTAAKAGSFAPQAAAQGTTEADIAGSAISRIQQRALEQQTQREQIALIAPGAEVLPLSGSSIVVDAVNRYRLANTADAKAATVSQFYDMLSYSILTQSGADLNSLFTRETIDDWAIELLTPGKMQYEFWRYDSGPIDMIQFRNMTTEQQMVEAARIGQKLVDAKAGPITALGVLERISPEGSLGWTTAFAGLDLLGIYTGYKAAAKLPRMLRRASILKRYNNAPGVAAEMGEKDVAGRLSAMVLHSDDPKTSNKVGIDRTTAGMNASPFPWNPLDSSVTDGISEETLKYIEDERKIQNYYLNRAINKDTLLSAGFFRPEERAVAALQIRSRLPAGAEVLEQTPFGVQLRVTTKNAEKFTSPEELSAAEKKYDVWRDAYEGASDELDRFYQEAVGKFDPDVTWVNKLEAQKARAKEEMDNAYNILVKGIEPDVVEEKFVWYTRDMFTGGFDGVLESSPILPKVVSPDTAWRKIDPEVVPERTVVIAKQEQLHKLFKEMMYSVLSSVSRKEADKLNSILIHGDDLGTTFTAKQLERGVDVPGVGTVKLDKTGIAGYFKARDVLDDVHGVRSISKFKRLGFEGYKQTAIAVDGVARRVFVKNAVISKTLKDGTTSLQLPSGVNRILDMRPSTGAVPMDIRGTSRAALIDKISEGKAWFVKFEQPVRIGDDMLNYGLVYASKIEDLTPNVLPYRKGYVPRIYDTVPYVVRAEHAVTFDGTTKKTLWETERFFGTRKEADTWASTKSLEDGVKRVADTDNNWKTKDPSYQQDVNEAVFTGLYEDYRGNKIPYGPSGEDSPRVGAFDAMDRYLSNLSWSYPLNEWRQSVLARYFNSVNKYLEVPNDINSNFSSTASITETQKNAIIHVRDYLKDQLSISTEGERIFARTARQMADSMEDSWFWNGVRKYMPKGDKLTEAARMKFLYGADNYEGYGLLRNAAFRVYLGFMNISQLVVQASNMAVVASLHPLNAPSVMRRMLSMRMMANLTPESRGYEKAARIAAKAALMKYEDFEPMVRALYRSGWTYTVRSSADAAMALRGIAPGGDVKHLGRLVDSALMFPFTEGELLSRIYSFTDTYIRMARKYPGVDLTTPDRINDLIKEATRVSFNYTQANRAYWQKGPWSIPTQFLQVPMKFYEAVFMPIVNKNIASQFTRMERLRLVLGQAILFGSFGIPFGPMLKDSIAKMFREEGDNGALYPEMSDDQIVAITGGVTDWMAHQIATTIFDEETHPMISNRVALANGFDLLISNFTGSDPDLSKALTGAAGGVIAQRMWPAIDTVARVHGTQLSQGNMSPKDALSALDKLATMTSSWNNYHRARLWEQFNAIVSREGSEVLPLDPAGRDMGLIALKKVGIGSYEEYAVFKVKDWNAKKNPTKEVKDAIKTANLLLLEYSKDGYRTPEGAKLFSDSLYLIRESLSNEIIKDEFDTAWNSNVSNVESIASKEYMKLIDIQIRGDEEELGPPPMEVNFLKERVE